MRDWRNGLPPISDAYSHFTECSSPIVVRTEYRGTKSADAPHIVLCADF